MEAVVLEPPYGDVQTTEAELAAASEIVVGTFLMWDNMVAVAADHPDTTWLFLDYAGAPTVANGVTVTSVRSPVDGE